MRGTEACIRLTGSDGPEHDQPIFVRHLDTINYRKYMSERSSPSGDSVYQSKHGRWTYSRHFLLRVDRCAGTKNRAQVFPLPTGVDVKTLFLLNMEIGLPGARTNSSPHFRRPLGPCDTILRYGAQLQNAGLLDQECLNWLLLSPDSSSNGMMILKDRLFSYLSTWENLPEELQLNWRPPSFWDLASEAGILEKDIESTDKPPAADNDDDLQVDPTNRTGPGKSVRTTAHGTFATDDDKLGDGTAPKTGDTFSEDDDTDSDSTDSDSDNESIYDDHAAVEDDVEADQENAGDHANRARGRERQGTHKSESVNSDV